MFLCSEIPESAVSVLLKKFLENIAADDDECSAGTDTCDLSTETCVNTAGGFECRPRTRSSEDQTVCPPGYKYSRAYATCTDVDECMDGTHDCATRAGSLSCVNTRGSYHCADINQPHCPNGYTYDELSHRGCIDIDECSEGLHTCLAGQECVNSVGSFHCNLRNKVLCQQGYGYNHVLRACLDVDECREGTHDCQTGTICVNSAGAYSCASTRQEPKIVSTGGSEVDGLDESSRCSQGFVFNSREGQCEDVDECALEIDTCYESYQVCRNALGSYVCECERGFSFDEEARSCQDVNECLTGEADCLIGQRCANTVGSFACERETNCGTGYTLNGETQQCEDDDECHLGTHSCGPAFQCKNTYGSFRCVPKKCSLGFAINQVTGRCQPLDCQAGMEPGPAGNCVDMDECLVLDPCAKNQHCMNTVGSYRCIDRINCGAGYEMNADGTQCLDLDECVRGTDECRGGQMCQNRPGGYVCQCQIGYAYDRGTGDCQDVDECAQFGQAVCSLNADCENTEGSYRCICRPGFQLAEDGKNCRDLNECEDASLSRCEHGCLNTWGSYQCTCHQGYKLTPDKLTCADIDECSLWTGRGSLCVGDCRNTVGSYECVCPDGYSLQSDGRTCEDENECDSEPCGQNEICLNTRGGHRCNPVSCPRDYVIDPDHNKVENGYTCVKKCQPYDVMCHKDPGQSITYSYVSVPSIQRLYQPMTVSTLYGFTFYSLPVSVDYSIISGNRDGYFKLLKTRGQCQLQLTTPVSGPYEDRIGISMDVNSPKRGTIAKHLAYINVYVSPFLVDGSV